MGLPSGSEVLERSCGYGKTVEEEDPAWSSAARGTGQTVGTVEGEAGDWKHGSEAGAGAAGGGGGVGDDGSECAAATVDVEAVVGTAAGDVVMV